MGVIHFLVPDDIKCNYIDACSKYSYFKCMHCRNNKVVVEQYIEKRKRKKYNYFSNIKL